MSLHQCHWVRNWNGARIPCDQPAEPGWWFCGRHFGQVAEIVGEVRRRARGTRHERDVLVLRARLEDALRQLRLTEARAYYARRADGLIKIGYSISVAERMGQLRGEHGPLEVLATEPGGHEVEGVRHYEFRSLREEGEWFRPGPALLRHVKRLQAVQQPLALRVEEGGAS